jgi:threonine 3-dehydrogenase
MKALILSVNKNNWSTTKGYQLADIDEPHLDEKSNPADADSVILAPVLAGVCGTDKGIWFRKAFRNPILHALEADHREYRVAGHEILARIEKIGSNVAREGRFKVGNMVSAESHLYCGKCHACLAGDKHVCINERIIGVTADGGFAEKIKLPANVLWATDTQKIRPEVAAIQEPFGNAVHACAPFPGASLKDKNVAIFGCGTIGLFSIMIARAMGAKKIIGIEPNERNQAKAKQAGADKVISPSENSAREIQDFFNGNGADYCLEMSGFSSSVIQAIQAAGHGGAIVLFGLASGDLVIPNFEEFIIRGKRIYSVVGRRVFDTWDISKRLLEDKANGIQDKIWEIILERGQGTLLSLKDFNATQFEDNLSRYSKTLVKIQ